MWPELGPHWSHVMLNRIKTVCLLTEEKISMQKLLARDRDIFRGIHRGDLRYDLQKSAPGSSGCWFYCKWGLRKLLRSSVSLQSLRAQVPACHCQSVTMIYSKPRPCCSQQQLQTHLSKDTSICLEDLEGLVSVFYEDLHYKVPIQQWKI